MDPRVGEFRGRIGRRGTRLRNPGASWRRSRVSRSAMSFCSRGRPACRTVRNAKDRARGGLDPLGLDQLVPLRPRGEGPVQLGHVAPVPLEEEGPVGPVDGACPSAAAAGSGRRRRRSRGLATPQASSSVGVRSMWAAIRSTTRPAVELARPADEAGDADARPRGRSPCGRASRALYAAAAGRCRSGRRRSCRAPAPASRAGEQPADVGVDVRDHRVDPRRDVSAGSCAGQGMADAGNSPSRGVMPR